MSQLDFGILRSQLQELHKYLGDGFIVSASWSGNTLQIAVARPITRKIPWMMSFDEESDYALSPEKLAAELADGAKRWFEPPKQDVFHE